MRIQRGHDPTGPPLSRRARLHRTCAHRRRTSLDTVADRGRQACPGRRQTARTGRGARACKRSRENHSAGALIGRGRACLDCPPPLSPKSATNTVAAEEPSATARRGVRSVVVDECRRRARHTAVTSRASIGPVNTSFLQDHLADEQDHPTGAVSCPTMGAGIKTPVFASFLACRSGADPVRNVGQGVNVAAVACV